MVTDPDEGEKELPAAYRWGTDFIRLLLRIFFRRVELEGLENIPKSGGGVLVAWHPNGVIDPGLIIGNFPKQIVFGARSGLFKWPLLGRLMRALDVVPIYRTQDKTTSDPAAKNKDSLKNMAATIAEGSYAALFPEGESHDLPHLQDLKTGAARIYYMARKEQRADENPPSLIPVGLHYNHKRSFRSKALIVFHPPIEIPPDLDVTPADNESDEEFHKRARGLTEVMESALNRVIYATESWEIHQLLQRARKLIRAERAYRAGANPGKVNMKEKTIGLARIWSGYEQLKPHKSEMIEQITQRVKLYDLEMSALGVDDHELDKDPKLVQPKLIAILLWQLLFVFLFLPPLLLLGYFINLPPALFLKWGSEKYGKMKKDIASIKILGGVVLYPFVWGCWTAFGVSAQMKLNEMYPMIPNRPLLAGFFFFSIAIASALVVVSYVRLSKLTIRSVKVRFTKKLLSKSVNRLLQERSELHDIITKMSEGLQLPGEVLADGSIVGSAADPLQTEVQENP